MDGNHRSDRAHLLLGGLILTCLLAAACQSQTPGGKSSPDGGSADGGGADGGSADGGGADGGSARRCNGCEVVRHVRVVDADGARPDRRVLIEQGVIVAEEPDVGEVQGASGEIDGTGHSLIPGLWDGHVHLLGSGGPSATALRFEDYTAEHLRALLYSGVTGLLDLGTHRSKVFAVRARIASGDLLGPRLYAAGALISAPGGHPCTTGYVASFCQLVTNPATGREAVDQLAPEKPDLIKLVIEGGVPGRPLPRVEVETARAVVEAARRHGLGVIAHIGSRHDLADALDAGVAAVAHTPYELIPQTLAAEAGGRQLAVVSTLSVYAAQPEFLADAGVLNDPFLEATVPAAVLSDLRSPATRAWYQTPEGMGLADFFRQSAANALENVRRLHASGARIIAGSDCGNTLTFHGPSMHRELELLVAAGLTPVEAITAATLEPARLLGVQGSFGRVAEGLSADLVLVEGDVSVDISAVRAVQEVWLRGERLDRRKLTVSEPDRNLVRGSTPVGLGGFCVDDPDCAIGLGCTGDRLCATRCDTADPATCPDGHACYGTPASAHCYPSAGCSPLAQDCPYANVYPSTCIPVEADYTFCMPAGPRAEDQSCSWSESASLCGPGLYCGLGERCYALCDPMGSQLPACGGTKPCVDLSSSWGQPVGLCVQP